MARRAGYTRIERNVIREFGSYQGNAIKLLQAEHAMAVRIVRQAKALQLHGLRDTDTNEFLEGYEAACVDILAALAKGRA